MTKKQGKTTLNNNKGHQKHPNKKYVLGISIAGVLVLALAFFLAVVFGFINLLPGNMEVSFDGGTIMGNVTINGVTVSNLTPEQAKLALTEQTQAEMADVKIKLKFAEREEEVPLSTFGVAPNLDDTIAKAMLRTRSGGMGKRLQAMKDQTPQAYTLAVSYDNTTLEEKIREGIAKLDLGAVEPHVEVNPAVTGMFEYVDGEPGITVDVDAFTAQMAEAIRKGTLGDSIEVPGTIVQPQYTVAQIKANTVKVSSATTSYASSASAPRVYNIKKMCGILSGSVILPGETYSVNDTAGPRTVDNGWQKAKGIENGVYTDQAGGGICQVSSTLYNALLKADVNIVARRPHSIPAKYVKHGLDAMITTGGSDLKFSNPTEWPMFLLLYVNETDKTLTAEVYGTPLANGMTIRLESVDIKVTPFDPTPVIVTDEDLVRDGRDGYVAEAWKVYCDASGKEIKRVKANTSTYASSRPHVLQSSLPSASPIISPTPPVQ